MTNPLDSVHPDLYPLLTAFSEEMIPLFRESLSSLILYGSGAGVNYIPGKSNVNLLMVMKELKFFDLLKYQKRAHYWKERGITPPLFTSLDFLEQSRDVFPIEWQEIISHHILLYGQNPFTFSIDRQDLRRECEREVRKIQVRLRQAFLETEKKPAEIEHLAMTSLNSVFPVLRSLLLIQHESPPIEREKLIELFFRKHHLSPAPFLKIWAIKKGKLISKEEYLGWFEDYLNQLEELSKLIDQIRLT
ncbi:MAG: hypothetical protein HY200_10645 [Nitrospirae bacterium]|nr:hypothetical protein [Nitrospirota bacterium]